MTRRRPAAAALALLLGSGAAVLAAAPALGHSVVVDSTPAEGEVLAELPEQFSVTANEPMLVLQGQGGFALFVQDEDGRYYGDGCVSIDAETMSTTAPELGAAGDYALVWQFVSADGHTVSGEIPFEWAPSASGTVADGSTSLPSCGAEVPPDDSGSAPDTGSGGDADGGNAAPASDSTPIIVAGVILGAGLLAVIAGVLIWALRRPRDPA